MVKAAKGVEPHLRATAQNLHGGVMRSPASAQGPFVDSLDDGGVLSPKAAGEHFETDFAAACLLEKLKILGLVI